jgi:c-di-GMP-binding flagellar brake protein YcgR
MADKFMERRRHIRIPMVSVVQIRIGGRSLVPGLLVDLSAGGARVMSQFPISIGEEIFLRIPLFEEKTIEVIGEVVWSKELEAMKEYNFGVEYMGGIQFKQANQEIGSFIQRHVSK